MQAFDTKMTCFYFHPNIHSFYSVVSAMSSQQIGKGLSPFVDILFSILSHNRLGLPPPKILHNLLFSEALVMTAYSKEHLATYAKFWDKQHVLLWIKKIVNVDQFVGLRPYFERIVFRTLRKFDQKCQRRIHLVDVLPINRFIYVFILKVRIR